MNRKRIKGTFAGHPDTQEFHVTSDSCCFFQKTDAEAYANGLPEWKGNEEKLRITTVTRAEAESWPEEDAEVTPPADPKADYTKMKKAELQAALTAREIVFDDKATNAELIALLEADDAAKAATAE